MKQTPPDFKRRNLLRSSAAAGALVVAAGTISARHGKAQPKPDRLQRVLQRCGSEIGDLRDTTERGHRGRSHGDI